MACFPGQPGYAGTRKVKPIWILMKQEMMGVAVTLAGPYANDLYHVTTSSLNFLQTGYSSWHLKNSVKALKAVGYLMKFSIKGYLLPTCKILLLTSCITLFNLLTLNCTSCQFWMKSDYLFTTYNDPPILLHYIKQPAVSSARQPGCSIVWRFDRLKVW